MLYALGHPLALLVLLVSYVVGLTLHGWAQSLLAVRLGERRLVMERRHQPDPRRQLEPFGWIAAAVSGLGWVKLVALTGRRGRGQTTAVALVGPAVNIVLGLAVLVALRLTYGPGSPGGLESLLQGGFSGTAPAAVLLAVGGSQLYLGVLSLVPLPPLDGGQLLFALAPRTLGWQRAEHALVEQNFGLGALLVLLLLPLGGGFPLLPTVLDEVLGPLVNAVLGG